MSRKARAISASGYYHVILRGNGHQIIFEDKEDNERFINLVRRYKEELGFDVIAYCLMENHVHLVLNAKTLSIDSIMRKIATSYAMYYNRKYSHTGHLFQDRFRSEVIEDEYYLLTVVRYVHFNPEKASISRMDVYPWSSYGNYLGEAGIISPEVIITLLGSREMYLNYMNQKCEDECLDVPAMPISDEEALVIIQTLLGLESGSQIQTFNMAKRNAAIRALKQKGLRDSQIERLTGVSRKIVAKC